MARVDRTSLLSDTPSHTPATLHIQSLKSRFFTTWIQPEDIPHIHTPLAPTPAVHEATSQQTHVLT